jgi:hypothetical protein
VGLKYRSFTMNQAAGGASRVCFIPGEFAGEDGLKPRRYGELNRQTRNATSVRNPREILEWSRTFTISIWGVAASSNQLLAEQDDVALVEDLLEQVVRGIYSASIDGVSIAASIQFGAVTVVAPPTEKAFGAELLITCVQNTPLYGETLEVVSANPNVVQVFT